MRKEIGRIYYNVFSTTQMVVVIIIFICYAMIGVYVIKSARHSGNTSSNHFRTIRSMMAYVLAFLFQWWPIGVISIWGLVGIPDIGIIITAVIVVNLGACYNAIAYVYLRNVNARAKKRERKKREAAAASISTLSSKLSD